MKIRIPFLLATAFMLVLFSTASVLAQESRTPEHQTLAALEKAIEAMQKPMKFERITGSSWRGNMMYRNEAEALQEKLAKWQDSTQTVPERSVDAETMIADWRNKAEKLQALLSQGDDPDMEGALYSAIVYSWQEGAEGLEEAAKEMEMAIQERNTDISEPQNNPPPGEPK